MNWTKEQGEAIKIRDKSILVSAAAGSGKTAVLVERIKQLIVEEAAGLDEMLIVTFTNAAASEMREKIVSALPEQSSRIHKAHISTFHAFAMDVVKRYFHLLPIEPSFLICDDVQKTILQAESLDYLFAREFETESPDFLRFLNLYATGRNEETPKKMILELHEFLQSLPSPFTWLDEMTEKLKNDTDHFLKSPAYFEICSDVELELEQAIAICGSIEDTLGEAGAGKLAEKAKMDGDGLRSALSQLQKEHDIWAASLNNFTWQQFRAREEEKPLYEEVRETVQKRREEAKASIKRIADRYCAKPIREYIAEIQATGPEAETLCRLIKEFDHQYRLRKQKKGLLDFSDIEHYALEILNKEEAANEYREKFKYIFVDEYQDSNLVQESIVRQIRRDNNVFMVGDVKQSIYKFRLAEPEIFLEKYEACRRNENPLEIKLDLNRNFRSKGQIISFINEVFGNVMNRRSAGMDYDSEAALYKGVPYEGPLDRPVELHLVEDRQLDDPDIDEELRDMKKAELEAYTAARIIKEARGTKIFCCKKGEERTLEYRDIVILLRSAANVANVYSDVLEAEGIPTYMDTGDGFFDTQEVAVFLNLLKVIDNRRQDIPLLSVLRSPVFQFSIDEMANVRSQHRKGSYYEAFHSYGEGGSDSLLKRKCNGALLKIEEWRQKQRFLPLPEFLWELLLVTGFFHYAGALPGGIQRQANLRALVDKASKLESQQGKGLFGFINYIEEMKERKILTPQVKLLGEGDDVVRILTVHKSKGLEFPMVIAGNLGRRFHRPSGKTVVSHKDLGFAMNQVDRERGCYRKTILQNAIEIRRSREDIAEEIRILYVSLTRAMDRLIMLGTVPDALEALKNARMRREWANAKSNSFMDYLLPILADSKSALIQCYDRTGIGAVKKTERMAKEHLLQEMKEGFSVDRGIHEEVDRRFRWEYPHTLALTTKSKYSVTDLAKKMAEKSEDETSDVWRSRFKMRGSDLEESAMRGTAYHRVMERIPFEPGMADKERIVMEIDRMIEGDYLSSEEAELLDTEWILSFFRSQIGKRACKAKKMHRETPFTLCHPLNNEEVIVQGIIDCYFEEDGNYVLLDYKSNRVEKQQDSIDVIANVYRPQLELYRTALEKIRGIKIDEMYLYLFALGREIRI